MPLVSQLPLFKITDKQVLANVEVENVYWYIQPSGAAIAAATIGASFNSNIVQPLTAIQVDSLTHVSIEVEQVNVVDNFATVLNGEDGQLTGTALPSFTALGARLVRTTKETRNGFKRIAGGREEDVSFNTWEASYIAAAVTATGAFDSILNPGGGSDLVPCIVRQTKDPESGQTLDTSFWQYNPISAVLLNPNPTSQVSRKFRGG